MRDFIKNKKIVAGYCAWVFIQLALYLSSTRELDIRTQYFWPFTKPDYFYMYFNNSINLYDESELFIYSILPVILLFLYDAYRKKGKN